MQQATRETAIPGTNAPRKTGNGSARIPESCTVLRLSVRNHAGVMSHVSGLFARRAFNMEGILCLAVGDGSTSTILLLVNEDERLEQVVRQLRKLEDVLEIHREADGRRAFHAVAEFLG
jgi:acetolactate synthase-1/3 small subunit